MKRALSLLFVILLSAVAFAQTQQGYVKTIGRPGKPGHALSQVTVRIKGNSNSLLSNEKGMFSFDIRHETGSNTFIISSARKQGYVIADNDLTSRPNPYSATVPTVVVMVSQAELEADKRAIEEKTRQAVQSNYDQRIGMLERQLENATISEEHYKAELAALMDWYDNIDNLVAKMAEYYARVDYDHLTEEDAAINLCIEQGQLDRADSLIDARGKIGDRILAAKSQIEQGQRLQTTGASIEQDGLAQLRSAQQDAEHKYNIAMARYDNLAALEMLKQLVESDTTKYEYLLDIADFYRKMIIDYSESEKFYQRAYAQACAQNDTIGITACLSNYGILLSNMGDYEKSIDLYNQALNLRLAYSNEFTYGLASCYSNIITHSIDMGAYSEARRKCYELLALIDSSDQGEDFEMVKTRFVVNHNLSSIFASEGNIEDSEKLSLNNLQLSLSHFGRNSSYTFSCYNSLGYLYDKAGRIEEALKMYGEALDIAKTLYGESHTEVAAIYSNISAVYKNAHQDDEAWKYAEKALEIRRKFLGDMHPDIAISLHNIGTLLVDNEEYETSIPYFLEAAKIREKVFPALHISTASSCLQLAISYASMPEPDYQKAVEYGKKAIAIYSQVEGKEYHYFLAAFGVAQSLLNLGETEAAIAVLKDLCSKDADWLEDESIDLVAAYILLRKTYKEIGDLPNALETAIGEFHQQMFCDASDPDVVMSKYGNVVILYNNIKENGHADADVTMKFNNFLNELIPIVMVPVSDSPAGQIGWSGTYDIVHYNDWDLASNPMEFFLYMNTQLDVQKDVIVYRDGTYFTHNFPGKLGTRMGIRLISPEEREVMLRDYKKNKKKLMKTMR